MKKIFSVILALTLSFSMAACSNQSTQEPSGDDNDSSIVDDNDGENDGDNVPAPVDFKVGMVTDVGGVNDQSFNQSAWEGMLELNKDTGIEVDYLESTQEADYAPNLDMMADSNANIIWGIGFMMGDALLNAAESNPLQNYAIIDNAFETTPDNMTAVVFRAQEPSFLVGYMASYVTETDIVGYIGGIQSETIDQFEYGFEAGVYYGAKEQGKEVTVLKQYAESFSDDAIGKGIATSMYTTGGADIVFHAAGQVGQGVISAAQDLDKLVIGVDRDQSDLAPDHVMTSALKLVGKAIYDVSLRLHEGENIGGQTLNYGIAEDAAGIPPYEGSTANLVEKDVYDKTIEIQELIKSGTIVPPYSPETYADFVAGLE